MPRQHKQTTHCNSFNTVEIKRLVKHFRQVLSSVDPDVIANHEPSEDGLNIKTTPPTDEVKHAIK